MGKREAVSRDDFMPRQLGCARCASDLVRLATAINGPQRGEVPPCPSARAPDCGPTAPPADPCPSGKRPAPTAGSATNAVTGARGGADCSIGSGDAVSQAVDLDVIERQIVEALAELRGARLDWAHSPNADTELTVTYAEMRLNRLLDRKAKTGH